MISLKRSELLSTALFILGPWSKQVIRHEEADSVCFDGPEDLTVSLSVSQGLRLYTDMLIR